VLGVVSLGKRRNGSDQSDGSTSYDNFLDMAIQKRPALIINTTSFACPRLRRGGEKHKEKKDFVNYCPNMTYLFFSSHVTYPFKEKRFRFQQCHTSQPRFEEWVNFSSPWGGSFKI